MSSMKSFSYVIGRDGTARNAHPTWFRGEHCNFIPSQPNLAERTAAEDYVLRGWIPSAPLIRRDHVVTAFGSCFAQHVSNFLRDHGYATGLSLVHRDVHGDFANSHVVRFGEGIVNTFALLQQFEWAYENKRFSEQIWHGSKGEIASYDESVRMATRALFERTDVFVLTLGLSEVWCNKHTQEVFWRAIPREQFNPDLHGFRVSTCAENTANLNRIVSLIGTHRPNARIVLTLSPIPLVATFRPVSCITANSVSKAILRTAIDEVVRANSDNANLHYWPSYELVKEFFPNPYQEDNRHIRPEVVEQIMALFGKYYLTEMYSSEELAARRNAAIEALAEVNGIDVNFAELIYKRGFRTPREFAETPIAVIARLRGVVDEAQAERLKRFAAAHVLRGAV